MSSPYPAIDQYFLLGKTLKSHGTGGSLRVATEDRFKSYITEGSYIFFDVHGSKVPYLVTGVEDDAHFVASLEDVMNKKESDLLSGLEIWIPLSIVKPRHQLSPKNLNDTWLEYHIIDNSTQVVYKIIRVEEYPQQLMAVIEADSKECLVPLTDHLISEIDRKEKKIFMDIPEGLLSI